MNEKQPINLGRVAVGVAVVVGCLAFSYLKRKAEKEAIDISPEHIQEATDVIEE